MPDAANATTATPEAPKAAEPAMQVVMVEASDFAPRTRKSTSEALTALKPALAHVQSNPDKVWTIVQNVTPAKSASLVSLLNERYDSKWTFGARSTDDGTAIVQARFSADPAKARPVRKVTKKATKAAAKK